MDLVDESLVGQVSGKLATAGAILALYLAHCSNFVGSGGDRVYLTLECISNERYSIYFNAK